jgi:hypothetical protein
MGSRNLIRTPTAWLPLVLSLAALALLVANVTTSGIRHHADEGTAARIFQAIMLGQAIIVAIFAIRWLPVAPRTAAPILALQITVALIPIVAVVVLESMA